MLKHYLFHRAVRLGTTFSTMKKFHQLVQQSKLLFSHKNEYWKREMWVNHELTLGVKPTPHQQKLIDAQLIHMSKLNSQHVGIDCTPNEKEDFRLACLTIMDTIKTIHEGYYNTIQISLDND